MAWNYIKNCGSWVNYSVMDSYYDKSCDICAQTVTLLAYELFRARSTRIAYEFRIFFNPLFRVEIFEYAMPIQNHMDAKSGYFLSRDASLSSPVLNCEYSRRCRAQFFRFFTSLT